MCDGFLSELIYDVPVPEKNVSFTAVGWNILWVWGAHWSTVLLSVLFLYHLYVFYLLSKVGLKTYHYRVTFLSVSLSYLQVLWRWVLFWLGYKPPFTGFCAHMGPRWRHIFGRSDQMAPKWSLVSGPWSLLPSPTCCLLCTSWCVEV